MAVVLCLWAPHLISGRAAPIIRHGLRIDSTSAFFVILTTLVTAAALTQALPFFAHELSEEHVPTHRQIGYFYLFSSLFLIAMYVVVCSDNLGFMWIGMEATTLVSAPLVYYYRTGNTLEATWKYLIVCSVGIALAFFGTALLYAGGGSLSIEQLSLHARRLPVGLLRLGYVFILLGYGTKAGLFPLHSWLPDAHSEAPAPTSAMMSGALLNCALVALWRVGGIMQNAGEGSLVRMTLLPMGVITVVAAALFLLKQHDLKRMLAYSSMENVGLMAVAIAIGSSSGFALQAANHSLVKVALFLLAGSIVQQYGGKKIREIRGMLASRPAQGLLLFALIIAVAGTPPFGSFLSEWQILSAAADQRHYGVVIALVVALAIAFVALSIHAIDMVFSPVKKNAPETLAVRPPAMVTLLLAASLALGVLLTPSVVAIAGGIAR
jgi:hydrogenase-4 component F